MVKVKAKETKVVAPTALGKKKEKKVLEVVGKSNGTPDPKVSLKSQKRRNRRKKNKMHTNGTEAQVKNGSDMNKEPQELSGNMEVDKANSDTSVTGKEAKATTEIKTPEVSSQGKKKKNKKNAPANNDTSGTNEQEKMTTESQETTDISEEAKEANTQGKKKKNKNKKAPAIDGSSDMTNEQEKTTTESQDTTDNSEEAKEANTQGKKKKNKKNKNASANDTSSTVTEGEKTTTESQEATDESEKAQEAGTQGKRKRNRKNKRKAEALEDTKSAAESTEDKEEDKEDDKPAKRMKVEKDDDAEVDKSKGKKGKQEKKYKLFIGNLPFDVTEEEIREHFKAVGDSLVMVTLMTRQSNTTKGKGYGFIELKDVTAYDKALKLNMSQLRNRKINVEFTTPGKNTKQRRSFIKDKTKKLLGQKKTGKGKKKGSRKH